MAGSSASGSGSSGRWSLHPQDGFLSEQDEDLPSGRHVISTMELIKMVERLVAGMLVRPEEVVVTENGPYSFVSVKALLNFHEDRAWDVEILMVFEEYREDIVCRLMQFMVPRNLIHPTVMLNGHPEEQKKYDQEQMDLKALHSSLNGTFPVAELVLLIKEQLTRQRPYLTDVQLPTEQIVAVCDENMHFFFACTGVCQDDNTGNILPFRIVGVGTVHGENITLAGRGNMN